MKTNPTDLAEQKPTEPRYGFVKRFLGFARNRIPPGARTLIGILLVVGGIFGFLPVLGFWMIPLGIVLIGMDMGAIWRVLRKIPETDADQDRCIEKEDARH